jgi:hypothetical protein
VRRKAGSGNETTTPRNTKSWQTSGAESANKAPGLVQSRQQESEHGYCNTNPREIKPERRARVLCLGNSLILWLTVARNTTVYRMTPLPSDFARRFSTLMSHSFDVIQWEECRQDAGEPAGGFLRGQQVFVRPVDHAAGCG